MEAMDRSKIQVFRRGKCKCKKMSLWLNMEWIQWILCLLIICLVYLKRMLCITESILTKWQSKLFKMSLNRISNKQVLKTNICCLYKWMIIVISSSLDLHFIKATWWETTRTNKAVVDKMKMFTRLPIFM